MIKIVACCLFIVIIAKVNKKAKEEKKPTLLNMIVNEVFSLFY